MQLGLGAVRAIAGLSSCPSAYAAPPRIGDPGIGLRPSSQRSALSANGKGPRQACKEQFPASKTSSRLCSQGMSNPHFGNLNTLSISQFPRAHFHSMAHGRGGEPGATMYRDANR